MQTVLVLVLVPTLVPALIPAWAPGLILASALASVVLVPLPFFQTPLQGLPALVFLILSLSASQGLPALVSLVLSFFLGSSALWGAVGPPAYFTLCCPLTPSQ